MIPHVTCDSKKHIVVDIVFNPHPTESIYDITPQLVFVDLCPTNILNVVQLGYSASVMKVMMTV
jgi:hypothetical protein